ncbi:MAG: ATP-binding cassette domain-containing protein [Flavobacteriales bacterium]|jgi:ABC-type multidrug transport system fused ATPase/permease subunit|nr:ATP-binding cassette domain-containing protein [Flavobacteriales bacterium]
MNKTQKKKANFSSLIKLYKYIKPYKTRFYIGIGFLLLTSFASLIFPKLVGDLIDSSQSVEKINQIAIYLLILFSAQALFSYFRIVLFVSVAEKSLSKLRQDTFNHLSKLPLNFFSNNKIGELNSRISADITLLQETFTTTFAEFFRQIILIVGGVTFLSFISVKLTLFMLSVLPVIMILAVYFGGKIKSYSKKVQKEIAESNNIVEETLQGIRVVKTFTNEAFESLKYKQKTDEVAKTAIKGGKYRGAFASFIILCVFGAIISVIWFGTKQVHEGNLKMGELFSFVLYTVFIGASVGGLADLYSKIQKAIGSSEALLEILEDEDENYIDGIKKDIVGNLEFRDVTFSYENRIENIVLNSINFTAKKGETVAIVGPSGAGKSTITSLILDFYNTTKGSVLIDDVDLKEFNLHNIRKQIGIVPQDTFLFGGTISENIAYGKIDSTKEEIVEAAKQANADEFINSFEDGYNTLVGERGIQLSGGQRQRIAIARTILKNPAILILDEATSSLDSKSESMVQNALEKLMKNRTTIVIAHRLSTIKSADKILVLDKGEIVEKGTHEELIKIEDGTYKSLSKLQFFNE